MVLKTGLRPYYDSLRAAGLIDAHYIFRAGTLYDIIGGRVVTPTSCCLQKNGLFIPYSQNASSSGNDLSGVTEFTMMIKANLSKVAADAVLASSYRAAAPVSGAQLTKTGANNQLRLVVVDSTGAIGVVNGANDSIVLNSDLWYSGTCKNNDVASVFVNGVQTGGDGSFAGKTFLPNTTSGLYFGNRLGGTLYSQEVCAEYISIKLALTEAQQQTLQAELDDTVYETNNLIINKDYPTIGSSVWEARYGLLAGEQTMSAGQDIGQLASLKVSTGTHKATTILYNGVPAKGIKCVTAGDIILPDTIPDKGTTWVYRYYDDSAGTWETRTSASATVSLDAVDDLILWCDINSQNYLYKY